MSNGVSGKGGEVSFTVTIKLPGEEPVEYQMTGFTDLSEEEFNNALKENKDGTDSLNSGA
jgi:hypothetical protein